MRIREVVLPASDVAGAQSFHGHFPSATRVRFESGPDVCSHIAYNVAPDRFAEATAYAGDRAALLHEDVPFPDWRARSAYFYDPDGNIIELIAREGAPGSELFLEVSEVGLPVSDVPGAVGYLERELGLPHFSGDRRTFSAIGDDRGLFIVVPVGRPWLFTDAPAPDAAVEVTVTRRDGGEGEREVRLPGSAHTIRLAS